MKLKHKYLALLVLVAVGLIPTIIQAQSTQTSRAQQILNRNQARNAQISDRDAEKLQRIDDKLEEEYEIRLMAQVDAKSQDIQADLYSLDTILNNVKIRLENVMTILVDVNIPIKKTATDIANTNVPNVAGLVAFDVEEKFNNFLECFDGSAPLSYTFGCRVFDLPSSNVEEDINGIQPLATQPQSAFTSLIAQLVRIGGPNSVSPTVVGDGYTKQQTASPWVAIPWEQDYRYIRDEAYAAQALDIDLHIPCRRGNTTLPLTEQECEFTDANSYERAARVQLNKLRTELAIMEGTFINTRQAIRAFIHDVIEAVQYYERIQAPYDPLNGNDAYTPTSREAGSAL